MVGSSKQDRMSALAAERANSSWAREHGFLQPEDFGFDFASFVSPYQRSAGNLDAKVFLVLQDWSSTEGLRSMSGDSRTQTQALGYTPTTKTNERLAESLDTFLGLKFSDTYITNVFPFIKQGSMSASLYRDHLSYTALQFTLREIEIVQPQLVIALGSAARNALRRALPGLTFAAVPHPAARISTEERHGKWGAAALSARL